MLCTLSSGINDWKIVKELNQLNDSISKLGKSFSTFGNYISHPILIWNGFVNLSYWALLIAAICFILIYVICNDKKQLQNSGKAFAIYLLIQIINLCLK